MLDITLLPGLRTASARDWRQLGDITTEAFADDPVNRWIAGNPRALRPIFRVLARSVYLPRGICHIAGDDAATMWCLSEADREPRPLALLQLVAGLQRYGSPGAAKRGMDAGEAMAAHHPRERHLYLFTIGTRAAARAKGLGKALLAPMLAAADRARLPVYLENSNPVNTGFYMSHGFAHQKLFTPARDAPPLEAMWRAPR